MRTQGKKRGPVDRRAKKPARKERSPSENEIHLKCWQWVRSAHPNLLIFHVANERDAPVQFHVKMKRKGVLSGVADFLAFPAGGHKFAIELKDGKGVQNKDQEKFQRQWESTGGAYFIVRTLEDFQKIVTPIALFG